MNVSFAGLGGPFDCLIAQTVPGILGNEQLNPDVGGLAVGISSESSVTRLNFQIKLTYSPRYRIEHFIT